MWFRVAVSRESAPCQKWANRKGFVAVSKPIAGVGHVKWIRDVRRSGHWFPQRGCILEHHIFRFAKMILRDRCSTLYDLSSLFRGRHHRLVRYYWYINLPVLGNCAFAYLGQGLCPYHQPRKRPDSHEVHLDAYLKIRWSGGATKLTGNGSTFLCPQIATPSTEYK